MAKTVQERSAKAAQKRLAVAEKELRHKVRPGIEQAMERIRLRGQVPIISEVLQIAIMKMDLMGDEELIEFLRYPRHEIVISEKVARKFYSESMRELIREPGDETVQAPNRLELRAEPQRPTVLGSDIRYPSPKAPLFP